MLIRPVVPKNICGKRTARVYFLWSFMHSNDRNKPNKHCHYHFTDSQNEGFSFVNFEIYLCELIPLKIKQDFEEFSDSGSEQGYILRRCMFDVLLNLVRAENSQIILRTACGEEVETITVHQNLMFCKTACSEGLLCD